MELRDLVFLGACQLLADSVRRDGFQIAVREIPKALALSKSIWDAAVEDKSL
jgi:hypothetical protein